MSTIFFPKPLDAGQVAETLFSTAIHSPRRSRLYGAFDGDVLMHWTTSRTGAARWASDRGLKSQRIA